MLETRPQDAPRRSQEDCVQAVLNHKTPKMAPRCSQDVIKTPRDGLRWKLRWASERSKRSARSDQDGLGELPSESCSKDTFRFREGRLKKAIQHVSPRAFILNAVSRSFVNTRFLKNAFGITFSMVSAWLSPKTIIHIRRANGPTA